MSEISKIEEKFNQALSGAKSLEELDAVRRDFVGGKGLLDTHLKNLKNLPIEERQKMGSSMNALKGVIMKALHARKSELEDEALAKTLASQAGDPTLPPFPFRVGRIHPLTQVMNEITQIFLGMGFGIAEGPEVETDENNFGSLNFLEDHPARDMHDTFFLEPSPGSVHESPLLLRTHTSPVQIREMRSAKPPLRIIAPGKVFRHEAIDATHSSVFHQVEGLVVDKNISFADLKGTLEIFVHRFFGSSVKTRLNPSYFPFVEPGAQMDILWGDRWLEVLGAGMVHPNVFKSVGYDAQEVSGFAFGMGVERLAMIRYGVKDMRLFYQNHVDFLHQF